MYVYILRSLTHKAYYVGLTRNLPARLSAHNHRQCRHTSKHAPWKIQTAIWFDDADRAAQFERYLKSGSGRAFSTKHF